MKKYTRLQKFLVLLFVYFLVFPGLVSVFAQCYRCTERLDDGNACESLVADVCPSGYTTNPNCYEDQPGGVCPTSSPPPSTTCYRCTTRLDDGNACESFTVTGECPTNSSTQSSCWLAVGGMCPQNLPKTNLSSQTLFPVLFGLLFLFFGMITYKYNFLKPEVYKFLFFVSPRLSFLNRYKKLSEKFEPYEHKLVKRYESRQKT